jgi:hypothetical protein
LPSLERLSACLVDDDTDHLAGLRMQNRRRTYER